MYIQLISIHGLIRGDRIEMGRDADTGGQVRYVLELARTLASFDEVTHVDLFTRRIRDKSVSRDYGEDIEQLGNKCRLVRLPCGGSKYLRKEKLWPYLDDFVANLIQFTRQEGKQPVLVHGHYADAGYVAKEVASAFGVPFVFTGHSLGRDKQKYLLEEGQSREQIHREFNMDTRIAAEEACLAAADMVVTSTQHEVETQYGRYDNGEQPRYEVIPPGTALERFFPYYEYDINAEQIDESFKQARVKMMHELDRFHFESKKPVILALCRPDKRKNINALIKAYGESKELQGLANLAIFAGIRKLITDMPDAEQDVLTDILLMMDRYDLYGRMAVPKKHRSETDVPELYRLVAKGFGVFVNPAYVEPFGLTLIESSACGLPFVATKNGGPQDIKRNCDSGELVDVSDPEALTAALRKLLTDRELWAKYSRNGVNRVREHYTWETHCARYLECVKSLEKESEGHRFSVTSQSAGQRLASVKNMLITDIDNTLLGDDDALRQLAGIIDAHKDQLAFGIASGRYLDAARAVLAKHGIEELDVAITSVGAEIYYGAELAPDKGWASYLRAKWRPERVLDALAELPFLALQEDENTQREFKISYDLDEDYPSKDALPAIHHALTQARVQYNVIFSHGTYVDILPRRASKGKAIRYLSNKWHVPLERIATAGDSGNDLDMLRGRTAGIVVGNHDEEMEELRGASRVYFAKAHNAAGIIEGLQHFGFIEEDAASAQSEKAEVTQ